MFQPLPTISAECGTARGGNVLGLDRPTDYAVLWLATLADKWADQKVFELAKISAWTERKSVGSDAE